MFKKIVEWAQWKYAVVVAKFAVGRDAVYAWLEAHTGFFKGFVVGFLVSGLIAARVACEAAKVKP